MNYVGRTSGQNVSPYRSLFWRQNTTGKLHEIGDERKAALERVMTWLPVRHGTFVYNISFCWQCRSACFHRVTRCLRFAAMGGADAQIRQASARLFGCGSCGSRGSCRVVCPPPSSSYGAPCPVHSRDISGACRLPASGAILCVGDAT